MARTFSLPSTLLLFALLAFSNSKAHAQIASLTIDSCYTLAKRNFPLIQQFELLEKTEFASLSNASKNYLPKLSVQGQASYQSEVTQVPIDLPNMSIPQVPKDQYRLYGELLQPLTDLIVVKHHKALISSEIQVKQQEVEVKLFELKQRVNELYFGILLFDEQLKQLNSLTSDLESGLKRTQSAIDEGVALKSNAYLLKIELLKVKQKRLELTNARKTLMHSLGLLINEPLNELTRLSKPKDLDANLLVNHRPELALLDLQKHSLGIQSKFIDANNYPRFFLFGQSGYGQPALNMLSDKFDFYYIAGVKLSWNLSGFYTSTKEKKLLRLGQKALDLQKEVFLFENDLRLQKERDELMKIDELIQTDLTIIDLHEKVKASSKAQLENGTITAVDYISTVTAEDRARQQLALHRIQHLALQYTQYHLLGH